MASFQGERLPLQCFDSSKYTSLNQCDHISNQCIAPTAQSMRCRWKVDYQDISAAMTLRQHAQNLPAGPDRDIKLAQFVLLHCCTEQHRSRLLRDGTGCLTRVALDFSATIGISRPTYGLNNAWTPSSTSITQLKTDQNGIVSPGLRSPDKTLSPSGTATTTPQLSKSVLFPPYPLADSSTTCHKELEHQLHQANRERDDCKERIKRYEEALLVKNEQVALFTPHRPTAVVSLRDELLQSVHPGWTRSGDIYVSIWPAYPDFVQICHSVDGSAAVSQACSPGALLSWSEPVMYPKKVKALVQLQLAQHRHEIGECQRCHTKHDDWFKVQLHKANKIVREWALLMDREPLYDSNCHLTAKWKTRIANFDEEISARGLLSLLDTEASFQPLRKEGPLNEEHGLPNSHVQDLSANHVLLGTSPTSDQSTVVGAPTNLRGLIRYNQPLTLESSLYSQQPGQEVLELGTGQVSTQESGDINKPGSKGFTASQIFRVSRYGLRKPRVKFPGA